MKKKRTLDKFRIDFISSCDRPAQEGAVVAIAKGGKMAEPTKAQLEERVAQLEKTVATATEGIAKVGKSFEQLASLSPPQYTHYHGLAESDRAAFLAKSDSDRDIEVTNAAAEDPVIYKSADGTEYRKSDGHRVVRMAREIDGMAKQSAAFAKSAELAVFAKQAQADYGSLPGTPEEQAELLYYMKSAPQTVRDRFDTMLKSGNAAIAKTSQQFGSKFGEEGSATAQLDKMAETYAQEKGVDFYKAYGAVTEAQPELFQKAIAEGSK